MKKIFALVAAFAVVTVVGCETKPTAAGSTTKTTSSSVTTAK